MTPGLDDRISRAAESAREHARAFPGAVHKDELPWVVIAAFDKDVRGSLARDPRIEDERDRVLITAVQLAEMPADEADETDLARERLIAAIDGLETAARRSGGGGPRKA